MPIARNRRDRIGELLRRQPAQLWAFEAILLRQFILPGNRRELVGARVEDRGDERFHVVAARHELAGHPVQNFRTPRFLVHFIHVCDDTPAQQSLPDPVDQRARHPAITRVRKDGSGSSPAVRCAGRRDWPVQFRIKKSRGRELLLRDVAAVKLQLLLGGEVRRQRVRVLQLPPADKAVMAGIAFEIDTEKNLRRILRGLQRRRLARTHRPSPVHADQKAVRIVRRDRIEKLRDPLVVRSIRTQSGQQPVRDAFAPRGFGVIRHSLFVAEQIVPVGDPVLGVFLIVRQKSGNQPAALVRSRVAEKGPQFFRLGQQAPYIEIGAAGEHRVRDQRRFGHSLLREIGGDEAIERIGPVLPRRWRRLRTLPMRAAAPTWALLPPKLGWHARLDRSTSEWLRAPVR